MASDEKWLAAAWPFVSEHVPPAPATVLEVGCGPLGGFVPRLRSSGYDAVGVDPEAPLGPGFSGTRFEHYRAPAPVDLVVASLSLHHVGDLDEVIDRMARALRPGGTVLVLEWAWERFDERTAQWCFERLSTGEPEPGWLHRRRQSWLESGKPWPTYMQDWATEDRIHPGHTVLEKLSARFRPTVATYGPYYFPDLDGVAAADEQAAIEAGAIQAARISFVGHRPGEVSPTVQIR